KLIDVGLQIMKQRRVTAVTSNRVYLDDGEIIHSNTVVCTVGNAPHRIVRQLCEEYGVENEKGRIITDDCLRIPGQENLWAAGDCARVPNREGAFCPATAQFAFRQGTLCGHNVARVITQRKPRPFRFKGVGELAAIGRHRGVGEIYGRRFSGFLAWWMWRTVYLTKLPGLERKIRVLLDWTLDLFFSRNLNLLNPDQTKLYNTIHLEAGDRLFNAGEPALALYVVISGCVELQDGEKVVKQMRAGEFFGERALTKNLPFIYDAVAKEASELTSLDGNVFRSLVDHSEVLRRMFKRTATQYKTREEMEILKARIDPSCARLSAQEIMSHPLTTLSVEDSLKNAISIIRTHRHSSYPLVDENQTYQGTLSREDLFCLLKSSSLPLETSLCRLDKRTLPVIPLSMKSPDMIETMLINGVNKLMVEDSDKRLVGIVTLLDLLCESSVNVAAVED
ncbi:MAG: cyclic nucleotide-binding domain-containing protein, partial [Verrucomicrobiota bacterium]